MESVKLQFGYSQQLSQIDRYTGKPIERGKVTETLIYFPAKVVVRGLVQGFVVEGRIEEKNYNSEQLERQLRGVVVEGLSRRSIWNLFRLTELQVKTTSPEIPAYEAETQIDEITAEHFEQQARVGNEACNKWRGVINKIQELLRDGPHYHLRELRSNMGVFEQYQSAFFPGMMHLWCVEKLAYLRSRLRELSERKNPNHPTYQRIVSEIEGYLSTWPVENIWHQHPPIRPA